MIDTLIGACAQFKVERISLSQLIQEAIKRTDLPLERRWALFCAARDILPESPWVMHLDALEADRDFSWYDDFYVERHSTVYLEDIVDSIKNSQDWSNESKWHGLNLNPLKEEILEKGFACFNYDW